MMHDMYDLQCLNVGHNTGVLQTLEAWNCMCLAFPENSKDGSCVVLTS